MPENRSIFRFGPFEIDEGCYQIRKRGQVLEVPARVFDLILELIRERHRVVPRQELLRALWGPTQVSEESLTRAISTARAVLDDRPGRDRWITTVPKRGYRFVGECEEVAPAPSEPHRQVVDLAPLVGRDGEIQRLEALLAQTIAGRGRFALISGEPGIGKSHLVEHFAERARATSARVVVGRHLEYAGGPGLTAWFQIFDQLARALGVSTLLDYAGPEANALAEFLPGLQSSGDEAAGRVGDADTRAQIFRAVARVLRAVGQDCPLAIVLDDLHRANEPALDLLRALSVELRGAPVLVIGSYRDAELPHGSPRAQLLSELSREATPIPLGGLDSDDVAQLVERVSEPPAAPSLVDQLLELTGGNPFFLEQLLAMSADRIRSDTSTIALPQPLPRAIADALRAQLSAVPESTRDVLRSAAVLGRRFSQRELETMAAGAEDVDAPLADAVERNLLRSEEGQPAGFRFAHSLIRDQLYAEIPPRERRARHRRAGEALVSLHRTPAEPVARIAFHFLQSVDQSPCPQAVEYAIRAGDAAMERTDFREAAAYYRQAHDVLSLESGAGGADARCRVLLRRALAESRAGERDATRECCLLAAEIAREYRRPTWLARAALVLWPTPMTMDDWSLGNELRIMLDEAFDQLGDSAPDLRARILARRAVDYSWTSDWRTRAEQATAAVALARESGDGASIAAALLAEIVACPLEPGVPLDDLDLRTRELLEQAERALGPVDAVLYRLARIWSHCIRGQPTQFDLEIERFHELANRSTDPQAKAWAGVLTRLRGLLRDVPEDLETALFDSEASRADLLFQSALVAQNIFSLEEQGRVPEANAQMRLLFGQLTHVPPIWACVYCRCVSFEDPAIARPEFERLAADDFKTLPNDHTWLPCMVFLADTCVKLGDRQRADELYRLLLPFEEWSAVAGLSFAYLGSVATRLARLAFLLGRERDGREHLEVALARETQLDSPPWRRRALSLGAGS